MSQMWAGDAHLLDLVRIDFAEDHRDGCLTWIDEEWIPTLIASRSPSSVTRYRCINGDPQELILIGSHKASFHASVPTIPSGGDLVDRWTRNFETASYRRLLSQGAASGDPELINVISTEVLPNRAQEFSAWYSEVHVPEILTCPGWVCGRRFVKQGPGNAFLAVYQVSDVTTPFASELYEQAVGWDGFETVMVGFHGFRLYERVKSWFDGA